jgi:hypothetical protein
MHEDAADSADERTDTESSLLEQAGARGADARAEPTDDENGSSHPPGFHEPSARGYSAENIARREREPAREEA